MGRLRHRLLALRRSGQGSLDPAQRGDLLSPKAAERPILAALFAARVGSNEPLRRAFHLLAVGWQIVSSHPFRDETAERMGTPAVCTGQALKRLYAHSSVCTESAGR